jgi:hypothetical protein
VASCDLAVGSIVDTVGHYLYFLAQSFGDLNEVRTVELRLLELVQTVSVPDYLTKFT